jgi:hypothetical protein
MYRNEDAVGKAVKESGLKREDVFVSKLHVWSTTLIVTKLRAETDYACAFIQPPNAHRDLMDMKRRWLELTNP